MLGWTVATSVLADERSAVGAAGIGLERRTANLMAGLVDHHDDPVLSDRVVEIAVTAGATRRLLDRSCPDPENVSEMLSVANNFARAAAELPDETIH